MKYLLFILFFVTSFISCKGEYDISNNNATPVEEEQEEVKSIDLSFELADLSITGQGDGNSLTTDQFVDCDPVAFMNIFSFPVKVAFGGGGGPNCSDCFALVSCTPGSQINIVHSSNSTEASGKSPSDPTINYTDVSTPTNFICPNDGSERFIISTFMDDLGRYNKLEVTEDGESLTDVEYFRCQI